MELNSMELMNKRIKEMNKYTNKLNYNKWNNINRNNKKLKQTKEWMNK